MSLKKRTPPALLRISPALPSAASNCRRSSEVSRRRASATCFASAACTEPNVCTWGYSRRVTPLVPFEATPILTLPLAARQEEQKLRGGHEYMIAKISPGGLAPQYDLHILCGMICSRQGLPHVRLLANPMHPPRAVMQLLRPGQLPWLAPCRQAAGAVETPTLATPSALPRGPASQTA